MNTASLAEARGTFLSSALGVSRFSIATCLALFCWLTFLAFVIPHDPDESVYKIIATGMLEGRWPYKDLFDHKPPLLYLWYLPAGFGASIELQRIVAAAAIAASVPVFETAATRLMSARRASLALAAYALLLANPFLLAETNSEAFVLVPLTGSVVAPSAFIAGILLGIASMTKLQALVFVPVVLLVWKRGMWRVALAAAGVVGLTAIPFLAIWGDFWASTVSFNLFYGDHTVGGRLGSLASVNDVVLLGGLPLWVAAVAGAVRQRNLVIWLWAGCGVLALKATGFDFAHYYVLLVPPAALLAGFGLDYLLSQRFSRVLLAPAISIMVLVWLAGIAFSIGYRNHYADIGAAIASTQGEVYMLGDRVQIYAAADRQPQRRFFFSVPLVMNDNWGEQMRRELLDCPPEVLVVPDHGLFRVEWEQEVAALYTHRQVFNAGTVLTEPRRQCPIDRVFEHR